VKRDSVAALDKLKGLVMGIDKARLALILMTGIAGVELIGIFVTGAMSLRVCGVFSVPDQLWHVLEFTLTLLAGAVGAQALNGKMKEAKGKEARDDPAEDADGGGSGVSL
jgi:hypothetical protein